MAAALNKLGDVALEEGEVKLAGRRFADSLALYRDLNDRGGLATTLKGLGDVARIDGHFRRAAAHYRESLGIARDMGHNSLIFTLLVAVADLLFRMGDDEVAAHSAALASDHPSSAHDTALRARALLAEHGLNAPQLETGVDWSAAFEAACDAAARALKGGATDVTHFPSSVASSSVTKNRMKRYGLHRRPDILIEVEEVGRVVFVL